MKPTIEEMLDFFEGLIFACPNRITERGHEKADAIRRTLQAVGEWKKRATFLANLWDDSEAIGSLVYLRFVALAKEIRDFREEGK